jgi:hypothetical protein
MSIIAKTFLFTLQALPDLAEGVLVVAGDLLEQILLLGLFVLQVPDAFILVLLQEFELLNHFLVGPVKRGGAGAHGG